MKLGDKVKMSGRWFSDGKPRFGQIVYISLDSRRLKFQAADKIVSASSKNVLKL